MFFYVDESGHTGHKLFDSSQPTLFYGLLSSKLNVSLLAEADLKRLRDKLGVERLHANEIGLEGLAQISEELLAIQKKFNLTFDLYFIEKVDYALINFFDQVFDQGVNPAMTWTGYWTPLRYVLLEKLRLLFDEDLLKRAWEARIERQDSVAEAELSKICNELKSRVHYLPDERSRNLLFDVLDWAGSNPAEICYNRQSKQSYLQISPNLIGFQFVLTGIANRLKSKRKSAKKIIVDQQSQFDKAQKNLQRWYLNAKESGQELQLGIGLPESDFQSMADIEIVHNSSANCAGLELVDIYLWIFKRLKDGKEIPQESYPLVRAQMHRGRTDGVSLQSLLDRWQPFFANLPDPTGEQLEKVEALKAMEEARRVKAR